LRRNCLLQRVTEGKIQGGIEVTGRQGRRRKKLLDDLKERRGYSHLKKEPLARTMWTARFGRGFGPVLRQTTKWMNKCLRMWLAYAFSDCKHLDCRRVTRCKKALRAFSQASVCFIVPKFLNKGLKKTFRSQTAELTKCLHNLRSSRILTCRSEVAKLLHAQYQEMLCNGIKTTLHQSFIVVLLKRARNCGLNPRQGAS